MIIQMKIFRSVKIYWQFAVFHFFCVVMPFFLYLCRAQETRKNPAIVCFF